MLTASNKKHARLKWIFISSRIAWVFSKSKVLLWEFLWAKIKEENKTRCKESERKDRSTVRDTETPQGPLDALIPMPFLSIQHASSPSPHFQSDTPPPPPPPPSLFPPFLLPSFFYFSITKWQGKCRLSGKPLASMTPRKAARPWAAQPVSRVSAPVPVSFPVHQCAGEANDWIQSAAWLMRGTSDPGQAINHVIRTNVPRKKQNTPSAHGIHCIHLHLCMHAVKACQGHRDGEQSSSPLQITLQRQEMREVCVYVCICVCVDKPGWGGVFQRTRFPPTHCTLIVYTGGSAWKWRLF